MKLEQDFDIADLDSVNKIIECVGMALPLCSKNVHASRFVNYMCQKILPSLTKDGDTQLNGSSQKEVYLNCCAYQ